MLGTLIKKKLTDSQLANIFINAIYDTVENGFPEVANLINEDPAFVESPNIKASQDGEFALIVIVGNLSYLDATFEAEQSNIVERMVVGKLAKVYQMSDFELEKLLDEYRGFISRVNHPSKNMLYGMTKAIFHKYKLNDFQDDYFKRMQAPNPLFLKRLDEVVENFVWNWNAFFRKYKLS